MFNSRSKNCIAAVISFQLFLDKHYAKLLASFVR